MQTKRDIAFKPKRFSKEPAETSKKKKKKKRRRDYSSMLTILVGPDKQPFCVHKNFICKRAKFFKASCADGRWLEGKTNTIALPITEPDVFQTYLDWAYTDDFGIEYKWDHRKAIDSAYKLLFGLWILGDFIDDEGLRCSTMCHLIRHVRGWPKAEIVCEAWESAPEGSLLETMIVDKLIRRVSFEDFESGIEDYPGDLVLRVVNTFKREKSTMKREDFVSRWATVIDSDLAMAEMREDEEGDE